MATNYKEILNLKYNLASSQLSVLSIPNKNTVLIKNLLNRKIKFSDRGNEVGSINYISKSSHYFIKTKALKIDCFLPFLNNETTVAIRPQVFKEFDLKEDDLIISKDANIGEAVVLDQDYPNFTMS
ncbi:27101_t:CDS:1, partial [Racocetra persica]